MINDINHLFQRELISKPELEQLKAELINLTFSLENLAFKGGYNEGAEVAIYISNIPIDTSYMYFEYGDKIFGVLRYYYIHIDNKYFSDMQREWIELMKRYPVLISQSGEVERLKFFNEQRHLIETLLKSD